MSSKQFWDERYKEAEYAYGKSPNSFLFQELKKLTPGKLLLPFEGEGRNAVAAARLGWLVTAFDQSVEGKKKALLLALENQIEIDYLVGELNQLEINEENYDTIGLIYAHLPDSERKEFHRSLVKKLKPGGYLILEGFHIKQLGKSSGGPKHEDMLFTKEILLSDFKDLLIISLIDLEIDLEEGVYHKGKAHVVRMVAKR